MSVVVTNRKGPFLWDASSSPSFQASIIEQKSESIFYEKHISDVIIVQDDDKRFFALNPSKSGKQHGTLGHGVRSSKRSPKGCRLCQKSSETAAFDFRRNGSRTWRRTSARTMSNSRSSSRTLSTNLSIDNNGDHRLNEADATSSSNVTRRSSEPVSGSVDASQLKETKVFSSSFVDQNELKAAKISPTGFDRKDAEKFSSNDRKFDQIRKLVEDKNPVRRIPTQVNVFSF